MLKSPTIILLLSISPFVAVSIFFNISWCSYFGCIYIYSLVLFNTSNIWLWDKNGNWLSTLHHSPFWVLKTSLSPASHHSGPVDFFFFLLFHLICIWWCSPRIYPYPYFSLSVYVFFFGEFISFYSFYSHWLHWPSSYHSWSAYSLYHQPSATQPLWIPQVWKEIQHPSSPATSLEFPIW